MSYIQAYNITADTFARCVPAARTKNNYVFDRLAPFIEQTILDIDRLHWPYLRPIGNDRLNVGDEDCPVVPVATITAFLSSLASLDIVLTSTGFGIVSTGDTAPASAQRVAAIRDEYEVKLLSAWEKLNCQIAETAYKQHLLGCDSELEHNFPHPLCLYSDFRRLTGLTTARQWREAQPTLYKAGQELQAALGYAYSDTMNALRISQRTELLEAMQRYASLRVLGREAEARRGIETYTVQTDTLHHTPLYISKHNERYKNRETSSAYFFS